jgi:hypothetical protein
MPSKNPAWITWKSLLVSCLAYSWTLKMEGICSSETSVVFQRTTRLYILIGRTVLENLFLIQPGKTFSRLFLWNPVVRCHVYKILLLDLILSQFNAISITILCISKMNLNNVSPSTAISPSCLHIPHFLAKILYVFIYPMNAKPPNQSPMILSPK